MFTVLIVTCDKEIGLSIGNISWYLQYISVQLVRVQFLGYIYLNKYKIQTDKRLHQILGRGLLYVRLYLFSSESCFCKRLHKQTRNFLECSFHRRTTANYVNIGLFLYCCRWLPLIYNLINCTEIQLADICFINIKEKINISIK